MCAGAAVPRADYVRRMPAVQLESIITCPFCGHHAREQMAGRRLPVLYALHRVRGAAPAGAGRLLRVLLIWHDDVPAEGGSA
jgi:hypothetical protein